MTTPLHRYRESLLVVTANSPALTLRQRIFAPVGASIAAASITAMLHLLIVEVGRHLFDRFAWWWSDPDVGWMLPLGYLIVLLPVGFALAIVGAILRDGVPQRVVIFCLVSVGALSLLLLFDRVASVAWLIVAVAVAVRTAEWSVKHAPVFRRGVQTLALGGIGVFVAYGVWSTGGRSLRERWTLASAKGGSEMPNVLLIILDTVTATDLGVYGNSRPTSPTLDSLAANATLFEHAYSSAPWTLPAHATIFTGLLPSEHGADWKSPLGADAPTLAEAFRDSGYATGAFTANLIATGHSSGLDRGFTTYMAARRSVAEVALHSTLAQSVAIRSAIQTYRETGWLGGAVRKLMRLDLRPDAEYQTHHSKSADVISDEFLAWNRGLEGRRFFAFLNYFDAHAPYLSPVSGVMPEGRTARARHERALRYIDGEIARVLQALQESGELDRTIVVVTADHGEQFGEHGLAGHGNSLYRDLLHVPLLIRLPNGRGAGVQIPANVSMRDLPRTLASVAGVSLGAQFGGESLQSLMDGTDAGRRVSTSQLSRSIGRQEAPGRNSQGAMWSVIDDSLHLILSEADQHIEAYNFRMDPRELNDLALKGASNAMRLRFDALRPDRTVNQARAGMR